uniref:Uncharacterized protein n=1 Tax=Arundo donax TaxID=35708 RepID=A0A0A8ZIB0_ARUDO
MHSQCKLIQGHFTDLQSIREIHRPFFCEIKAQAVV